VVPNGARHCQHAHDSHTIPEQDLTTSCLHTGLHDSGNIDIDMIQATSKFTLFSDHNGSLLRRQPGAKTSIYSSVCLYRLQTGDISKLFALVTCVG